MEWQGIMLLTQEASKQRTLEYKNLNDTYKSDFYVTKVSISNNDFLLILLENILFITETIRSIFSLNI